MDRTPFHMFFYGTLKRGGRNHGYCRGALLVRNATVRGAVYDLPQGYPALVVPGQDVLAAGTADYPRDARAEHETKHTEVPDAEDGPAVFGELYTFDDPGERLPEIDRLEGFVPGNPSTPYRRVLIPARTEEGTALAWAYVTRGPAGTHLPGGRWPA